METFGDSDFRRATKCSSNACVEVAVGPRLVAVRGSNAADGTELIFTHDEWATFVSAVRDGEFSV